MNHGIFPIGGSFAGIRDTFHNGVRNSIKLGAKEILWIPIMSTLFQLAGFDGLTKKNLNYYMKKGYHITCIPYGFQEAARMKYGESHSVIQPGIFNYVIKHKYDVRVRCDIIFYIFIMKIL